MSEDCKPCNQCNLRFRTCALYPNGCEIIKAIAARDKWWVDKIDNMFMTKLSSGEWIQHEYIVITDSEWQQLKEELEGNNERD